MALPTRSESGVSPVSSTWAISATDQGGVPSIRQDKLADWSVEDILGTLTTGDTPDSDRVGGPMVEVVRNISQLSDADRHAMAVYIKSLPPAEK